MKRRRRDRARRTVSFKRTVCSLGSVLAVATLASCHEIDTTRVAPFIATLGDDLYGVLCDRLGASSFTEDNSGQSYQAICHPTADGVYGNEVDESVLPPASGDVAIQARERSIAKLRAMARWRADLVRAFNAIFPDRNIPDVTTEAAGDEVRLHDGLFELAQALKGLYEANPYEEGGDPLLPQSTQALARALDSLAASDEAKAALSRVWGRRGYRPFQVGLGAVRSALGYPDLRGFTKAALGVLGPKGAGNAKLQELLRAVKVDLATSAPEDSLLPPFRMLDVNKAQPERPRTTLEFTGGLFLDQNSAYAEAGAPEWHISLRDRRGFVVPAGNVPGEAGTVPSPFVDANLDGFADLDTFGRFIDGSGAPVTLAPPFAIPGVADMADATGAYATIDTSRTAIAAVTRSARVLADPQNGALMDALAGAHLLFGPRVDARYDFTKKGKDAILSPDQPCPTQPEGVCVDYRRFKGEESPLVDLLYAAGPLLADADSDALLLGLLDLVENHEDAVARLLGAALKVRQIALDHDKLAEQGKEPLAVMPYQAPIWDQMAQVLSKIAENPGMTQALVKAFGDPAIVTPHGTSQHMGDTLAVFMRMRDELTYNPSNVNGPAINITVDPNGGSTADPKTPVDQTKPKTGKNVSLFQRTLKVIHDVNGVPACNKSGAYLEANTGGDPATCANAATGGCDLDNDGIGLSWPLIGGGYDECDLVRFENLAGFFIDSVLPKNHPKRSVMVIKDNALNDIIDLLGIVLSKDDVFQKSSGLCDLTERPEPWALARLVFFGAQSDLYAMPDADPFSAGVNQKTNDFVSSLIEPVGTVDCPTKPNGVHECNDASGTLRVQGANTIFTWERLGFYDYLRPVLIPFAEVPCADPNGCAPYVGEQLFVDMIEILHEHWGPSGGNTYEAIVGDAFETDLVPALVEFSKISTELSKVTIQRGPKAGQVWTGADVLAKTLKIMFSQPYAASIGLTDRKGSKATKWTDGTPQAQVTPFNLFADALHGNDVRFDTACDDPSVTDVPACQADAQDRKAKWKAARSRIVDEFLTIDGEGASAKFRNEAVPKVLARTLRLLREQVNARCPDRETTGQCAWARTELADKLATTFSGPVFAGLMDVQEALRADDASRLATERLLVHVLSSGDDPEALEATLASFADLFQVLQADGEISPILRALAPAANPADDPDGRGAADAMLTVLQALVDDEYDPYHVMDHVLPAAVTPMDDGTNRAPLEIILDAITDIHRIDAETESSDSPLTVPDYGTIFGSVHDFLTSETRGLEQFYFIVQNRPLE